MNKSYYFKVTEEFVGFPVIRICKIRKIKRCYRAKLGSWVELRPYKTSFFHVPLSTDIEVSLIRFFERQTAVEQAVALKCALYDTWDNFEILLKRSKSYQVKNYGSSEGARIAA